MIMVVVAVELVVEAVGVRTKFVAESKASKEALKSATILSSLNVNVIIQGQRGSGKSALAEVIMPNAVMINYHDETSLQEAIASDEKIIILNYDNSLHTKYKTQLESREANFVITLDDETSLELSNTTINIELTPLSTRIEDMQILQSRYIQEVTKLFGITQCESFELDDQIQNSYELKKRVYLECIAKNLNETELEEVLMNFFLSKIGGYNDYRDMLEYFDRALIKAQTKKFGSQLQVASHLGINRNTLRKKIEQYEL
jgi:DNA-binding NtrC family response regulator